MIRTLVAALAAIFLFATEAAAQQATSFPSGMNNLPSTHWLRGRDVLEVPFPARSQTWFDDFTKYTAGDWVLTATEAGGADSTEVLADADDGVLVLTSDINDNDLNFVQTVSEMFTFTSGKKTYFEARFKLVETIQVDFFIGLQIRDTTALAVSDGVFFQKDDGDSLLDFHSMSGSVDTASTGVHTMVADTYIVVAYYYDGATSISVAVNDVQVATVTATPPTAELTVSFGLQAGEATNVKTMSIDYIYVWKQR